jgi:peptidyl-prolyl cis-trans isomerase A (cyclophilin A)
MRKFPWLCFLVVAMLAPAVLHAQAAPAQATAPKPATTTHPAAAHAATDPGLLNPALLKATAPPVYEVTFVTTKGNFVVQVTRAWAPLGADRFYNLVKHHFFDGTAFFRVVPNFMVQFGLNGNPAVNRAWAKADIKDDPVTQSNKPGYITFATAGPNTRTTQVFISYGNNAFLDPQGFAPFGQVTSGMEVVTAIYSGDDEKPDQGAITNQGNAYLNKAFPNLDKVKTATVTSPAPAAPVKKPAAAAPAKKPAAAPQQ